MLTFLGENYFGEDNCECLCKTCEDLCQNGWAAGAGIPKASVETPPATGYKFRRTEHRRFSSSPLSRDETATPEVVIRPIIAKRTPRHLLKFKSMEGSPLAKSASIESDITPMKTPMKRKRELELLSPSPAPKKMKKARVLKEENVKEEETVVPLASIEAVDSPSSASEAASSANEALSTDATSVDEDTIVVQPLEPISKPSKRKREAESTSETPEPKRVCQPVVEAASVRLPGDYKLTSVLLAQPLTAWIACTNCADEFIQGDSYFAKVNCPRCERHSKLYGYVWPKTQAADEEDTEERVLDHRLIHRFVSTAQEKASRKKKARETL